MNRRPQSEVKALEALFGLLIIAAFIMGLCGCCPKVVQQPPTIVDRWDTAYISLPPPPPIVLPADSTEIVLNLTKLCDSTWRAQNRYRFASGQRIKSEVEISETTLRFTCKEDSLIHLLDSIRTFRVSHLREERSETIVQVCPSGWPKWLHTGLIVASFILCALCLIIVARSRT